VKPIAPGARILTAAAIALAAASRALPAQTDVAPYSTITVRAGVTNVRPLDQLKNYYTGGSGPSLEVRVPTELGELGLMVDGAKFQGTAPQFYSISTNEVAIDWQGRASVGRISVLGGMRVGNFQMSFSSPTQPGVDNGTNEFMIGPTATVDCRLTGALAATASGTWLFLPSATRAHLGVAMIGAGYTFGTPGWLRRFLQ
jgi:hypothetical protein